MGNKKTTAFADWTFSKSHHKHRRTQPTTVAVGAEQRPGDIDIVRTWLLNHFAQILPDKGEYDEGEYDERNWGEMSSFLEYDVVGPLYSKAFLISVSGRKVSEPKARQYARLILPSITNEVADWLDKNLGIQLTKRELDRVVRGYLTKLARP